MIATGALILALGLGATTYVDAGPFADSRLAPPDVALFVHVEGAAEIRKDLADRPISHWINSVIQNGEIRAAWSGLAKAANADEGRLLDVCLGQRCTFMTREGGQWALVTEVNEQKTAALLRNLNVRVREPRAGFAMAELPEQEMVLARGDGVLVVGPAKQAGLFYDVLPRLGELQPELDSLSAQPCMEHARTLGAGRIAVYTRHKLPLGGFSAAVMTMRGENVSIRHAAKFANAPFSHGVTKLACDFSPVLRFERESLVAFMQPTDVDDGPIESFLAANFGEGLLSPTMRKNLGDRRLVVVGEVEGRELDQPVDLLNPAVVSCMQVKDGEVALSQLDEQMTRVAHRLNDLGNGAYLIKTPPLRNLSRQEPREIDLSGATNWFTGGFPVMQNVNLTWTVTKGPQGAWFVVASDRKPLEDVVKTLKADCPEDPKFVGRFESCGTGNGVRISRHLQSWSDHANKFAEADQAAEFSATLRMMSELAGGMQSCRWQLARPSANEMRLDVQITLAPPESSREE